jgi:hypothetical protein
MGDGGKRPHGWHSRRHETDEAHLAARAKYQEKARPAARLARTKAKHQSAIERFMEREEA